MGCSVNGESFQHIYAAVYGHSNTLDEHLNYIIHGKLSKSSYLKKKETVVRISKTNKSFILFDI